MKCYSLILCIVGLIPNSILAKSGPSTAIPKVLDYEHGFYPEALAESEMYPLENNVPLEEEQYEAMDGNQSTVNESETEVTSKAYTAIESNSDYQYDFVKFLNSNDDAKVTVNDPLGPSEFSNIPYETEVEKMEEKNAVLPNFPDLLNRKIDAFYGKRKQLLVMLGFAGLLLWILWARIIYLLMRLRRQKLSPILY